MNRSTNNTTMANAIDRIASERLRAEADVVGSMLSAPLLAIPHITDAGVDGALFDDVDLRLVFLAGVVCHDANRLTGDAYGDRTTVLLLARSALRGAGLWHVGFPEYLANLAFSTPFNVSDLIGRCDRLIEAAARCNEARKLSRRLDELCEGWAA